MGVEEGANVDDDLLAHLDAALDGGGPHMRQQHDLAGLGKADQPGVDCRFVLEHVERRAGDLAGLDQFRQRVLVDDIAARGVDDIGVLADQLEPARRQQMEGGRACADSSPR